MTDENDVAEILRRWNDAVGVLSEPTLPPGPLGAWRSVDDKPATPPSKCTCDLHTMMREGCKCGALERERESK